MNTNTYTNPTVVAADASLLRKATVAILGSLVLVAASKVVIPFQYVGGTPAPMVAIMLGALFGRRMGTAMVTAFLIQGAMGLPVFIGTPAMGSGLPYMMGPTGGFLMGYLASAFVVGSLADKGYNKTILQTLSLMVLGNVVLYFFGATYLSYLLGFEKAAAVCANFFPAIFVKIGFGAAVVALAQDKIRNLLKV